MTRKRDALRRYADLTAQRLTKGETAENWAATRDAITEHLNDYLEGKVQRVEPEIALMLHSALQQADAKETPALFMPPSKKRGESPNTAAASTCISSAADYIVFCATHAKEPWVDRAPVKTVAEAFGVSKRGASAWKNHATAAAVAPPAREPQEHFELLAAGVQAAARLYPHVGGASAGAVRARARRGG